MTQEHTTSSAKPTTGKALPDKNRIYIVDDHTMFRDGLRQLIESDSKMTVCGDAPGAAEAMPQILASKPDVVIVDISLPVASGLDLITHLMAEFDYLLLLVVS